MKTATKVVLVLLGTAVAAVASQENARAYVSDCFCCLCSYLFGS